jgi:acyl-CoA hydrolase
MVKDYVNHSVVKNIKPTRTSHLVKYEDLNHHRTLFAGRAAEWLIEACFIAAARASGKPEDVVCAQVYGMSFKRPANRGDLVEITSQIGHVGQKSITVVARATLNGETEPVVSCAATFVTIAEDGKTYAHGVALPAEYLAEHAEVCAHAKHVYESNR